MNRVPYQILKIILNTFKKSTDNMPHLEITEVVLVHFDIGNNDY